MRRFLLPTSQNNYTPYLLHRSVLVIYVLVIFLFNVVVGQLGLSTVQAAVDAGTLYSLHNSNRAANGLGGLTVNNQLVTSATNKAQAMLASDCWDHYCPPGTSPWSFILNAGYEYIYAGENLGEGFTNSSTLMNAWMNSPTHRANVLSGNFTEI
ncbi:MAG TPA: CAP domain-containing protein, partial [Candidatus Dojkabacteria bacterium]|nr:CAP domain-containing protein [Candidatus Dojkabacteria bacterium]